MSQSIFKFPERHDYAPEKFLISDSNRATYQYAMNFPWESYALSINGPFGSGKTHLASIIKSKFKIKTLEDITEKANQQKLLHTLNLARENNDHILLTSEKPLTQLGFTLPDLTSRLSAIVTLTINSPDNELFHHLFQKHFESRQLKVSTEIIDYLAARTDRNFYAPIEIIEKIDRLSLEQKRNITIPLIKQIFHST